MRQTDLKWRSCWEVPITIHDSVSPVASLYGLGNEYDTDEHFMAIELKHGALDKVSGTVQYSPEFKECGC